MGADNMKAEIFQGKDAGTSFMGAGPTVVDRPPVKKPVPATSPGVPGGVPKKETPLKKEESKKEKTSLSKGQIALRATEIALGVLTPTAPPAVIHHVNYETQITPSAIGRDVASIPGFYWDWGKSAVEQVNNMFAKIKPAEKPSETLAPFDNAAVKGTITAANSILIKDVSEIKDIPTVPPGPNPKHDINILAPSIDISPDEKIEYVKEFIGDTAPVYYGPEETKYAKEHGIKETWIFKDIPKNTVIPAPADGLLEFSMVPRTSPPGTIQTAFLHYKGPDGILYRISVSSEPGSFKQLIDAEPFGSDLKQSLEDRKKMFVSVKRGDPIMIALQTTDLRYGGTGWPSGELGVGSNKNYPININFIAIPDGAGQNKLAILAK